ncbi:tautomerase family protein [Modestobacter sp. I12A-02662]|uniref:tautomerase family protein n=1 Tax=Modestobacter sp. I12A-02662 TaxID=1730496 RepID=UPI0034DF3B90
MPLVCMDVVEGRRTPEQLRLMADTVQEVMLDVITTPPRDRYQIGTEHPPSN